MKPQDKPPVQGAEQHRHAAWIEGGTRVGIVLLVASFFLHAFGWMPAHVPPEKLPAVWSMPVNEFLRASGSPTGWGWLSLIGNGDMAGLLGIAILAGCSVPALLSLVPLFARRGERALAALCLLEVLVIVAAASGLLASGH